MVGNLTAAQLRKLKAHRYVDDVEDEGMDEGRFFVHLKPGLDWHYDPHNVTRTMSFGDFADAQHWLKTMVEKV